ncbi:MAG: polysaccharide biosynthesis tyrosine autokinase, partial [Herminiimonas sp.]|nr:polysaccharide biosynthesis tyrosine autokinase [Herminiimonas sp.]
MMNSLIQQPAPAHLQQIGPNILTEDNEAELSSYFNVLYDNRWLIATIALAVALLGAAYAFLAKPVYEANMLIHVEEGTNKETKNIIGEMNSLFDIKAAATSEMELVRSRLVVSRAIDNLRLYISAKPKYFPVIGNWVSDHNKKISNPGLFGYGGYAWGGEKIDVSTFNVPDALMNLEFVLVAEDNGQYRLTQNANNIDLQGRVGTPLNVDTPKGRIEMQVDQLAARPGAQFLVNRSSRIAVIENVQKALVVVEQGKQSG